MFHVIKRRRARGHFRRGGEHKNSQYDWVVLLRACDCVCVCVSVWWHRARNLFAAGHRSIRIPFVCVWRSLCRRSNSRSYVICARTCVCVCACACCARGTWPPPNVRRSASTGVSRISFRPRVVVVRRGSTRAPRCRDPENNNTPYGRHGTVLITRAQPEQKQHACHYGTEQRAGHLSGIHFFFFFPCEQLNYYTRRIPYIK